MITNASMPLLFHLHLLPAAPVADSPKTGGKGDNTRRIFKPAGLVNRKARKTQSETVIEDRIQESQAIALQVQKDLLKGKQKHAKVNLSQMDYEIGTFLREQQRIEEEDIMFIMMCAANS